jgi:hypothetical protein
MLGCAVPRAARADDEDENMLVLNVGANIGLSSHEQSSSGFLVGGEASLAFLHLKADEREHEGDAPGVPMIGTPIWLGLYADLLRDTGSDTTRMSVGPELGTALIGVDGGLLAEVGGDTRWGVTVRPVLTVGLVSLYGRWGHFADDLRDPDFFEAGLLLKVPVPLWGMK